MAGQHHLPNVWICSTITALELPLPDHRTYVIARHRLRPRLCWFAYCDLDRIGKVLSAAAPRRGLVDLEPRDQVPARLAKADGDAWLCRPMPGRWLPRIGAHAGARQVMHAHHKPGRTDEELDRLREPVPARPVWPTPGHRGSRGHNPADLRANTPADCTRAGLRRSSLTCIELARTNCGCGVSKPGQAIPQDRRTDVCEGTAGSPGPTTYATDIQAAPESFGLRFGCANIVKAHI
jgi:hypothetical protein